MSRITDVLVSIDTEAILKQYGKNNSQGNPPNIDARYVYMTVTQGQAISGQAGGGW